MAKPSDNKAKIISFRVKADQYDKLMEVKDTQQSVSEHMREVFDGYIREISLEPSSNDQ